MVQYNNPVYDNNTHVREPDTAIAPSNNRVNGDSRPRADAANIPQTTSTSRSPAPPPQTSPPNHPPPPVPETSYPVGPSTSTAPIAGSSSAHREKSGISSRKSHRVSQPLPNTPHGGENSRVPAKAPTPPPLGTQQPNRILFYGEHDLLSDFEKLMAISQQLKHCMTIRLPFPRNLISKREMSLLLVLHRTMDGG